MSDEISIKKSQNEILPKTFQSDLSKEFIELCQTVSAKRPRTVINHILKHGFITTDDLSTIYNYDHPPRAIRDVRENGIPLRTYKITSPKTGRKIAAYCFDLQTETKKGRIGGRKAFSKTFKQALINHYGSVDAFTGETLESRYLQIDHRVPYEIAGESVNLEVENYMLLDSSSQRAKSWSCEHCENYTKYSSPLICNSCFWAYPDKYSHIAMDEKRRIDLVWKNNEVEYYDRLLQLSKTEKKEIRDYIKDLLRKLTE